MARSDRVDSQKAQRRKRRKGGRAKLGNGWTVEGRYASEQPLGPGVVQASPEEVFAAFEKLSPELRWADVAGKVVPLFERVRPYPSGMPALAQAIVPPGLPIGFGIDLGPAFITVTPAMVEGWSLSIGDVCAKAVANLHAIAAEVSPSDVFPGTIADVQAHWLQTHRGIGSVLALAPTELRRIFGPKPRLFIAPMRDLLIGFPEDVEREFAAWLFAEIASGDPNHLYPRAFVFDGRDVSVEPLLASAAA